MSNTKDCERDKEKTRRSCVSGQQILRAEAAREANPTSRRQ